MAVVANIRSSPFNEKYESPVSGSAEVVTLCYTIHREIMG